MGLFDQYPHLESERILIKKMTPEDASALQALSGNKAVYRYLPTFLYEQQYADAGEVIRRMDKECFRTGEGILLGVYLKKDPARLAGIAEIYSFKENKGKASIGCRLDDAYWGQGIATEVIGLLKDYLLYGAGLRTVTAHVMKENAASAKALVKNGFAALYPDLYEDWGFPGPVLTDKYVFKKRWARENDGSVFGSFGEIQDPGPAGGSAEERLKKQMAFALEIDKEKNIFRQTHLSGHGRRENDAEHAWHMAVMAYLLREYSNEKINIGRVMLMCLLHDIVEIDAGDTYAYDQEALATQKEREEAARERIFSLLPDDQKEEFTAVFDEFEENRTAEARFAHAMDNFQPLILNDSNDGGDWREHKVTAEQVYGRQSKSREGSDTIYNVTDQILKKHIARGNLL